MKCEEKILAKITNVMVIKKKHAITTTDLKVGHTGMLIQWQNRIGSLGTYKERYIIRHYVYAFITKMWI